MNNYKYHRKALAALRGSVIATIVVSLMGCEAALNLEGVDAVKNQSIRRTDQFQALAQNDRVQVAVGNNGVLLHRAVGEENWQRQVLDGQPGLLNIAVCPDNSFVALSFERQVWIGDADASQWQPKPIETPENLIDITCAPDGSFWAVGSFSTILSSQDNGDSWSELSLNEDAMLTSIQFLSDSVAFAAGEFGVLAKTTDGGANWEPMEPIQPEFYPQTTVFTNENEGWSVGLDGTVYNTVDGGNSWQLGETGVDAPLYEIVAANNQLFLLGDNATFLKRDQDAWTSIKLPIPPVYINAGLVDTNKLLLAGGNGVLLSVDL